MAARLMATDGRPGGEGLSGLARAFFYAGARSVVTSVGRRAPFSARAKNWRVAARSRFGEARTIHFRAAGLVGIEPLAAGLLQCLDLGRQILVGRRHPRITDQHAIFPKLIDNGPATELLTEMGFEKCALLTTSNGIGRSRSRAAVFP